MASKGQIIIILVLLFVSIFALGWQANDTFKYVKGVIKGEDQTGTE
jgi:hypothetical protein